MTEYEAVEAAQSLYANAVTNFAIFLSITSSYLVVAYLVGKSLSRSQVFLATVLFVVSAGTTLALVVAFGSAGIRYTSVAVEMRGWGYSGGVAGLVVLLALDVCIILGSLKFMWDVRHSKPE